MKHEWIIEWGDLVDEWLEKEAEELHAQNQPEPGNEIMGALQINDDWLMAYVDHTDHDNEEEWEWIPTPNEWQMLEETDPLDCVTLPLLFTNYEYELTYDQTSQRRFGQPPENLEDFFGNVQFYERCVEIAWNVEPTEYHDGRATLHSRSLITKSVKLICTPNTFLSDGQANLHSHPLIAKTVELTCTPDTFHSDGRATLRSRPLITKSVELICTPDTFLSDGQANLHSRPLIAKSVELTCTPDTFHSDGRANLHSHPLIAKSIEITCTPDHISQRWLN
ncbi:hypothetical protein RHSIM_Rhsim08G0127500 [Rhododendron simsii]|uniref:Uncharacterized protein n=1 Tax=Rhododendron simsii TaxID=118357 RepID=A0A834LG65_RHOSS|nr:hypothetical protein RHSIM_Rhsim08G0127500 [Rhododendron simsii]